MWLCPPWEGPGDEANLHIILRLKAEISLSYLSAVHRVKPDYMEDYLKEA